MKRAQDACRVRIYVDTRNCHLRQGELDVMEDALDTLEFVVNESFAELFVKIKYDPRGNEYHVRAILRLPKTNLLVGEHDDLVLPAYERCLRKLAHKVEARQAGLGRATSPAQPSRQTVKTEPSPSLARLRSTFESDDYAGFRRELSGFEEPIRWRIDRWIRRYAKLDGRRTEELPLDELVEEVLLTAFDSYAARPDAMRLGDWLDSLVAPSTRSFLEHPEEDREAIGYARTLDELRRESAREASPSTSRSDHVDGMIDGRRPTKPR